MSKVYYGENGYLSLLRDILDNGVDIPDRTGVGCRAIFDAKLVWGEGESTLSTVRPMPLRLAFEEFMFFLRGETNTKTLEEKGINFWKPNTSREFLDKRGLSFLPEGDLGAAYSIQWREFGGCSEGSGAGVDQLEKLINTLYNDRYSRRMVVSLWNPAEEHLMPLTPCWWASQYVVLPNKDGEDVLHVKLVNRSLDALFGAMFAVQQYRLFQYTLCKMFGFKLGEISCDLSHAHLYSNQLEYTEELLTRTPTYESGEIKINKDLNNLEDLLSLQWEDIEVVGHEVNKTPFNVVRPPMSV